MFGVALRYGISLDELKAANPTVIPNMMSVGTVLTIPITPTPPATGTNPELPVQTPDPFSPLQMAMAPICYQDALGGAYCFAQLENTSESPVENPSVRFTLSRRRAVHVGDGRHFAAQHPASPGDDARCGLFLSSHSGSF